MTRLVPCASCPFRTDRAFYLHPERAREIARALTDRRLPQRTSFMCHATIDYDSDDYEGEGVTTVDSRWCNGALIVMKKEGTIWDNEMARLAAALKILDPDCLDMHAPVPASMQEWIALADQQDAG